MARFTTKINSRGAIRGRTCARCATACPRNRRWFIARRTRYARARAHFPAGAVSMALRGRVPEIPRRRENKRPPARPSTFRASVVGVVGRRPRRGATVDTRATRDALFRETRPPRLVSRETRADRSALPAASPPRASAVRRRVSASPTKKNTRRTCAWRATATCTPRTASRARTSARP